MVLAKHLSRHYITVTVTRQLNSIAYASRSKKTWIQSRPAKVTHPHIRACERIVDWVKRRSNGMCATVITGVSQVCQVVPGWWTHVSILSFVRVHDFFEHIFYEIVVAKATPIYKRQLLYKRR